MTNIMKGILEFAKGPGIAIFMPLFFLLLAEAIYLPGLMFLVMTDESLTLGNVNFSVIEAGALWEKALFLSLAFYLVLGLLVGLMIFFERRRNANN